MTTSSDAADQSAAAGCDAARQLREAALPLPSEQSREEIAKLEACIADIKAGLCCPRIHGCEQNDGEFCLVRQAFARSGLIEDPYEALSTAHAEGLGKEDEYGVQTHVEPQHCTGWRDIASAPRDGTPVLAVVSGATGRWEHLNGRSFVIHHEGQTRSGFDLGWSVYPGFGGVSDHWFAHWMPLPAPTSSGEQSSQSEPKVSAGQDALDTISILQARQRELETERDEAVETSRFFDEQLGLAQARAQAAETRQRELEEALRPFAEAGKQFRHHWDGTLITSLNEMAGCKLTIAHLRNAAALLSPPTQKA